MVFILHFANIRPCCRNPSLIILILVNPAVVYHPLKKKYYLYFKGNVYDPTWRGVHGVAIADAPEGPFIVQDDYVFEFETGITRN